MPTFQCARLVQRAAFLAGLLVYAVPAALAQSESEVPHLQTARQLVHDLERDALINQYGSKPTFLRWGSPTREARTVCATFITRLLEHTYGWKHSNIEKWLGANGADAVEWQEAIVHENGFRRVRQAAAIHPGDILAIRYNDGSKDTGHVLVIDREPQRIEATAPIVRQTEQYEVEVIDSSASGHGPNDTRHKRNGGFTGGIGRGAIRLYANREGRIVGYAWSETSKSTFYHSPARELAVGRLTHDLEVPTDSAR